MFRLPNKTQGKNFIKFEFSIQISECFGIIMSLAFHLKQSIQVLCICWQSWNWTFCICIILISHHNSDLFMYKNTKMRTLLLWKLQPEGIFPNWLGRVTDSVHFKQHVQTSPIPRWSTEAQIMWKRNNCFWRFSEPRWRWFQSLGQECPRDNEEEKAVTWHEQAKFGSKCDCWKGNSWVDKWCKDGETVETSPQKYIAADVK